MSWASRVLNEISRARADSDAVAGAILRAREPGAAPTDREEAQARRQTLSAVDENLAEARRVLYGHLTGTWFTRLWGASVAYQESLAAAYRASEELFLVQSDAAVAARLPGLRAAVRAYLSPDDSRRESFLHRIDGALNEDGVEHMTRRAAGAAADPQKTREGADVVSGPSSPSAEV